MYCILNIHHDGKSGNWLSEGLKIKDKYINLWTQIAKEFNIYDEHLIFESMNEVQFQKNNNYDYETLLYLSQVFVDTIRNEGGNNANRLLLISGANVDIDLTYSLQFKLPKDPSNTLAVSIYYNYPPQFTKEPDDNPWVYYDEVYKYFYTMQPFTQWGSEDDYKNMAADFELLKDTFIDKGIPIIITEIGVLTEQKKEIQSIRDFLYFAFTSSADYDGIVSCLWDISKKEIGDTNYYNREENYWYDENIKNYFKKISKKKYVRPMEFYIIKDYEKIEKEDYDRNFNLNIKNREVKNVILMLKF